jgi:hypothetical protein
MSTEFLEDITEEFLGGLLADTLSDWSTALKYGEFLAARCPNLLIGHLILCRALRHTGDEHRATEELRICRTIVAGLGFREQEFLPELEQEEKFLKTSH